MRVFIIIFFLIFSSCNFPKDPEDSWAKARQDSLLIGVVNNPPFAFISDGNPQGSEIEILNDFARSHQLKIKYIEGSESVLVDQLKKYELHIVSGGFDKKTLWKKHAGASATYDSKHLFLIPKGENELLQNLETHIFQNK